MREYMRTEDVEDITKQFRLLPNNFNLEAYWNRVDRNIGFISQSEQDILRFAKVGIAGCGGMGGLLAATLLRAGIGSIKIADPENFETSNLNRQFAARADSIGYSKAIATAKMMREIAEDTLIEVYPEGITASTVESFVDDCDVIADELEFWAIGSRLLLHQTLPKKAVILNGNSVGMGTRLLRFTPTSAWKMEDLLSMKLEEAEHLQQKIQSGQASEEEVATVQSAVLTALVPDLPEYMLETDKFSNQRAVHNRLRFENRAPILASNPPMATGFLANHVILEILREKSGLKRKVQYPPDMPGYLYFDAALMKAETRQTIWWTKKEPS